MGKDETIFRVVKGKENPYAQVSKELIRDTRLGWGTRGLLAFLLSMPSDWEVRMEHLKHAGPAKRTALRSMIENAIVCGYMQRKRVNGGGHGQFRWMTLVYESPELNPDYAGSPSVDFPPVGNPSVQFATVATTDDALPEVSIATRNGGGDGSSSGSGVWT